jgi:hypothetical protein
MGRIPTQAITGELAPSVQKYQLSYIRPYHREIARRLVLGQKQSEIAKDMNIDEGRLSIIVNSPSMQAEVARLEAQRDNGVHDVTVQLQELQPVMLEVMERLAIYGSKESTRLEAAKDLLDRGPDTAKVKKFDGKVLAETHEERIARIMGVPKENIHSPNGTPTEIIDITPKPSDEKDDTQELSDEDKTHDNNSKEGTL